MKKLTIVALLSLTLTLIACSDSSGPDSSTTTNTTSSMTEPAEPAASGQGVEQGDQAAFEAGVDAANQTAPEKQ